MPLSALRLGNQFVSGFQVAQIWSANFISNMSARVGAGFRRIGLNQLLAELSGPPLAAQDFRLILAE